MYVYFGKGKDIDQIKSEFGKGIQFVSTKSQYNKNFKKRFRDNRYKADGCNYVPMGLLFPKKINKSLKKSLEKCDKLILGDHNPPATILKYMKNPTIFHIKNGTFFSQKTAKKNTILKYLWEENKKVKIIYHHTKRKYEFDTIKDCWDCFCPSYS